MVNVNLSDQMFNEEKPKLKVPIDPSYHLLNSQARKDRN